MIAERIAQLEAELLELREQQQSELVSAIALTVGPGVAFSASELWQHRRVSLELAAAFTDAGIHSPRQLGKRLRQLCGRGLERAGRDRDGAIWTCAGNCYHGEAFLR